MADSSAPGAQNESYSPEAMSSAIRLLRIFRRVAQERAARGYHPYLCATCGQWFPDGPILDGYTYRYIRRPHPQIPIWRPTHFGSGSTIQAQSNIMDRTVMGRPLHCPNRPLVRLGDDELGRYVLAQPNWIQRPMPSGLGHNPTYPFCSSNQFEPPRRQLHFESQHSKPSFLPNDPEKNEGTFAPAGYLHHGGNGGKPSSVGLDLDLHL